MKRLTYIYHAETRMAKRKVTPEQRKGDEDRLRLSSGCDVH